jgi:hypothetical protein
LPAIVRHSSSALRVSIAHYLFDLPLAVTPSFLRNLRTLSLRMTRNAAPPADAS